MDAVLIRSTWLDDPVASFVGARVVALLLTLAARAAQRGTPGVLTSQEWTFHLDPDDADRAIRSGLAAAEPAPVGGFVFRLSAWIADQLDTERAIARRTATRERVRRLRARNRGDQPTLFDDRGETGRAAGPAVNDLPCGKTCGPPVENLRSVTPAVTQSVEKSAPVSVYPRACARPLVRTSYVPISNDGKSAHCHSQKIDAPRGPEFRLLLAIVAASRQQAGAKTTTAADRARLLDDVRATCVRAKLGQPSAQAVRRAIAITDRDETLSPVRRRG